MDAKSNVAEPSTHWCKVIFEDTMVLEESHPGSRTHGGAINRATVNAKSNVGEPSAHMCEVIFEDNMFPEEFPTDLYHNTFQEMWLGAHFWIAKISGGLWLSLQYTTTSCLSI